MVFVVAVGTNLHCDCFWPRFMGYVTYIWLPKIFVFDRLNF